MKIAMLYTCEYKFQLKAVSCHVLHLQVISIHLKFGKTTSHFCCLSFPSTHRLYLPIVQKKPNYGKGYR